MSFDYILFDLDGTVTDSKPGVVRCIKMSLDAKGIPYTQAILDKMVGPPFRVAMKDFFNLEGDVVEDFIRIYRGEYQVRGWKECEVYPGIIEMFETLKKAGKHLALATSKPLKFTNLMMDGLNLRKYFDYIGGATDDSSGETKKDVINQVLTNLNITDKSRVLMIGDRLYDIVGAHEAGVKCVAELWGYGDREEFEKYDADYIFETTKEVTDFILNS